MNKANITKTKIIGWNINQRSSLGRTIPKFVEDELIEQDADIIVLSEIYKTENLDSFWKRMSDAGYDHAISNNETTNEVAIMWKRELYVLNSKPVTLIATKDNLNPNFLMVDLKDKESKIFTVVGYRIRIGFMDSVNEYKNRAKQMRIVMDYVKDKPGSIIMVTDSNNLRRSTEEKDWNLTVLDNIISEYGFYRNTPEGSSIFTELSAKGEGYEFAEDHIICKSATISELEYDRNFVLRNKGIYVWGKDFCHKDEHTGKYIGIAPGFPDHAIVKGHFKLV